MNIKRILSLFLICAATGGSALANDSTARIGTGGITLMKNGEIRIVEERLEISSKLIRVRYKFLNESTKDIKTTVAFPMPPYGWNSGMSAFDANAGPIKSFKLIVDGNLVPTRLSRAALIAGRDVSDELRKIGLSESQIFETFGDCTLEGWGLTAKQEAEFARLTGRTDNYPGWKVAETFYWEQMFPAGKEINIQHEYPHFVGTSYSFPYQKQQQSSATLPIPATVSTHLQDEACLDDVTRQAIEAKARSLAANGAKDVWIILKDVEYVLGTGRNWKGSIGNFNLQISKDSPDQIVSLCFPGKGNNVSPTTLEFSQIDYVPQDSLVIYFYSVRER